MDSEIWLITDTENIEKAPNLIKHGISALCGMYNVKEMSILRELPLLRS